MFQTRTTSSDLAAHPFEVSVLGKAIMSGFVVAFNSEQWWGEQRNKDCNKEGLYI
jgi:hypothetical protein